MNAELIKQRQEESRARREARNHNQRILEEELLKPYVLSTPDLGARAGELQYFHNVYDGVTYACLPPDADELRTAAMKLLGGGSEITVNVRLGVARVNKSAGDVYNRRIGRIVAASKITTVAMKLRSYEVSERSQNFHLTLGHDHIRLKLEKKNYPKFVAVFNTDLL